MKIEGEHVFNAPREAVWKMVRDPEVLASILPGTQELQQLSETEYEGRIILKVGPITGNFSGRIEVLDESPPESCTLMAEGEGKPGFFKGEGKVDLIEEGDSTRMRYIGEMQIGGRLASVGQRLLDMTSKSMIKKGFEVLDQRLVEGI